MADGADVVSNSLDVSPLSRWGCGKDFPFYAGWPVGFKAWQWCFVLLGVLVGFGALVAPYPGYQAIFGGLLPAILFPVIPLACLGLVAGRYWTWLFWSPRPRDFALMLGVAVLNLIVTIAVASVVRLVFEANANPAGMLLKGASLSERILFYLRTLPQLLGEEIVSILPFLALLWLGHAKFGLSRGVSLALAWTGTAVFFGAIHLPTYGWNFIQCFLIIGTARAVLLIGYVVTRNVWVSTGAHILNDWMIFTFMLSAFSLKGG